MFYSIGKTPHRNSRFWDKNIFLLLDLTHGADIFDSKEYVSDLGAET